MPERSGDLGEVRGGSNCEAEDRTFRSRRNVIEDVIVSGEMAVVRMVSHLTHAAAGREASSTGMIILRIRDGKIIEGWGGHDRLLRLQRLRVAFAETDGGGSRSK